MSKHYRKQGENHFILTLLFVLVTVLAIAVMMLLTAWMLTNAF